MTTPLFQKVGKTTLNIKRKTQGSYVNGRWVEGTDEYPVCIEANVQPKLTNTELMLLPEGDRTTNALKVYTTFPLRQRVEGSSPVDGDRFDWVDGFTYEVVVTHTYVMGVLNHTKAIAVRKELT